MYKLLVYNPDNKKWEILFVSENYEEVLQMFYEEKEKGNISLIE